MLIGDMEGERSEKLGSLKPPFGHDFQIPMSQSSWPVNQLSPPEAKIALFRSLFRGREDIYPRRFESRKTGKSGYAPACANEWVRGVCEKPRIKCGDCPNRRFLALTDDVVRWHLSGHNDDGEPFVVGIYPMLMDETCFFLAVDFDKTGWREDATAFLDTCGRLNVPAALERSRSGRGGHVWLFFDEAVPAVLARKLGSHILTETMERHPEAGLDSYDRFFPSQDTLPRGGFGNLIALPLQKQPRDRGNSVFVDENLAPYSDQWAFLSSVQKLDRLQLERIVLDAERRGRVVGVPVPPDEEEDQPWMTPPGRRRKETPIVGEVPRSLERPSRARMVTTRSSSCSVVRCGIGLTRRVKPRRLPTYGKGIPHSPGRAADICQVCRGDA
jgi:hypothetical protein